MNNGKTCVQRGLGFSADKSGNKSRVPVGTKVRVGRSPGNPRLGPRLGQGQGSRSRHRDSGSGEGRVSRNPAQVNDLKVARSSTSVWHKSSIP